jgi:hypothetical protein
MMSPYPSFGIYACTLHCCTTIYVYHKGYLSLTDKKNAVYKQNHVFVRPFHYVTSCPFNTSRPGITGKRSILLCLIYVPFSV